MSSNTIAIVGGGFSGAATAIRLLEAGPPDLDIHILDPRPALGWGIAYGDAHPSHILNVPAARMSLWSDRPRDFLDWARRNGPRHGWPLAGAAHAETYLPRRLFGHYVEAALEAAISTARAKGGPHLSHHRSRARAIEPRDDGKFLLRTEAGEQVFADAVILATGFRPPATPFPVEGTGNAYVADPWAPGALDAIGRDDRVLIVGTGLTMVDMIYALHAARHKGPVTAVSRHGLLPRVHGISEPVAPVVTEEDAAQGVVNALRNLRHALSWGRADWRSAIDGLRPLTDRLWAALPPGDQDRFLRHLSPYWEVHRHRMAAESSDLLLRKVAQGLLSIEAARVQGIRLEGAQAHVTLRRRHAKNAEIRPFDWIINCTPPAPPLDRPSDALARQLLADRLARPHRTGLGFDVDAHGTLLGGNGQPTRGLFTLGSPRRGHAVEATAVPHIRPQLDALLPQILDLLTPHIQRNAAS